MSAPTQPFAKGYGILLGLVILWGGSLVLFLIGKALVTAIMGGGEGA
jgi:hypothetical protein